jgi:GNAT superfamily N-acetyltransferase
MSAAACDCQRAGPEHAPGLLALFERSGSGCYCNYWHFSGDKNAWLERCYLKPEENRAALVARLEARALCGVVALLEGQVCGWLKLERASALPRLYDQRIYKALPCFEGPREGVFTVGCLYVDEAARGRGVATALLSAAITAVRSEGGSALEAFPRGTPDGERLRADEVWLGPETLFLRAGFSRVSDFRPYPVLRLHLPPTAPNA